jgi:peptide subunit release factor 1 (eRF1)
MGVGVAVITRDTVQALAAFQGVDAPVTSCYLDVDGRYLPTRRHVQRAFDALARRAEHDGVGSASVAADVARMGSYIRGRTSSGRGLAMFSCSAHELWEVYELPVRVASRLLVHPRPCVRQLEDVLARSARIGVLLADRRRARMFVYAAGELVDHSEVLDEIERHGADHRGELVKTRVQQQQQEQAQQHIRRAALLGFTVFRRQPYDHLVIASPTPDVARELAEALHPYLAERVAERAQLPVAAPPDRIRAAAQDAQERIVLRQDADTVARLRALIASGGAAVGGLANTLAALRQRRVERLFVSDGVSAEGWRCTACGCLAVIGRRCPACAATMTHVADVVEEALDEALTQQCGVDVMAGNPDLDVLGGLGALLRY